MNSVCLKMHLFMTEIIDLTLEFKANIERDLSRWIELYLLLTLLTQLKKKKKDRKKKLQDSP